MAGKGVIQNRLSQPLGSKYLSATDHTEVNCTEFVTQEDTIITLLEGGEASVAATDVDYKSSMNLDGVTLKKGALIVSPAGEAFQNINISEGSALAYNSVFKGEKPGPFVGLLDLYPNASAAYSLRKLRADYEGDAIEVRRSVGIPSNQNIGFNSDGELDTVALLAFVGAGDGFVVTWYDQSGNGVNDATQGSASAQPQIVNSGSINLQNGEPCAVFDGVDDFLTLGVGNSLDYSENNIYSFSVNKNNGSVNGRIWADDIIGTQGYIINRPYLGVNGVFINDGDGYESASNTPATSGVNSLSTLTFNGTTGIAISRQNGVQYESKTVSNWAGTIGSSGSAGFAIGSGADGGQYFDGNQQSLIIYTSNEASNLSGIETNINKHYNLYWDGSQAGLLDDYPNASAAYSLRALNSAYTGAAIQVRKTVDGTTSTLDIGLLYDGSLDTDSLLSFAGSNDVFVSKWYDQSGNGVNDATQGSASAQPQIVNSGIVNLENGKPCAVFDGVNDYLESQNGFNEPIASFVSVYKNYQNDNKRPFGVRDSLASSNKNTFAITSTNSLVFDGAFLAGSIAATISQKITYAQKSTTNAKSYINGVENNNSSIALNNTIGFFNIGNPHGALSLEFNGSFQMGIFYPTDQSANRVGIETNINDYYSVYE